MTPPILRWTLSLLRWTLLLLLLPVGVIFGIFGTRGGAANVPGLPQSAQPAGAMSAEAEYRKLDVALTHLRRRNAASYAVRSAAGIDEARYVRIGGIDQWVTIRGQDRANPVLLFLHGGPGDVTSPWAFALFAPWQEPFTVVQWDQRGAGRTLRKTGPSIASTITLDRIVEDGLELSAYLRTHLDKQKIIIVGHSFGSIVGLRMARARPDLFHAYVGTAQVADNTRNYHAAFDALVAKARALGHRQALDELTRVGPPPYASREAYGVQRKWSNAFEGADQFLYGTIGLSLVAPGSSVQDLNDAFEGQSLSAERLVPQTSKLGAKDLGLTFAVPMFVIQGAEDFTTPTALARDYLATIEAPRKTFVSIEGGGHFAVFMKSHQFLTELTDKVRPLAAGR